MKPVGYQWMGTHHFRVKLPKDAEKYAWRPVYADPPPMPPIVATMHETHDSIWFSKGVDDHQYTDDVKVTFLVETGK